MEPTIIKAYTQADKSVAWLQRVQGKRPQLAVVLGFTETGLLPGISAAGATPEHRRFTALADAEFLVKGPQRKPHFPLPPLHSGASPVFISRAVVAHQNIPAHIFNAGLPQSPNVEHVALEGKPAYCLTTGKAMAPDLVMHLWQQGLTWGKTLAAQPTDYLLLAECVVGGTTTALAMLMGLGIDASGWVNSSHPICNHAQKLAVVQQGFNRANLSLLKGDIHPLELVAALGDPMQPVVAGIAMAASLSQPVMLAGGTQMLAVYRLMVSLGEAYDCGWSPDNVVIGTTRWVADDPTGNTVKLAARVNASLIGTQLSFEESRFAVLRAYESGFVKEGVGAGACAIAASLYHGWGQVQLLNAIEALLERSLKLSHVSVDYP